MSSNTYFSLEPSADPLPCHLVSRGSFVAGDCILYENTKVQSSVANLTASEEFPGVIDHRRSRSAVDRGVRHLGSEDGVVASGRINVYHPAFHLCGGAVDDGDAAAGVIHVHQGRLVRKTGTTVSGCVKAAPSDVSVTIREVSAVNWKADVYDRVPADADSLC